MSKIIEEPVCHWRKYEQHATRVIAFQSKRFVTDEMWLKFIGFLARSELRGEGHFWKIFVPPSLYFSQVGEVRLCAINPHKSRVKP